MQSKVLFQTESVGLRQLLTTALRTKLGATLLFGVLQPTTATTAYFRCLSLHVRMQKWRGQDKFLSALPRPPAGPLAVEKVIFFKNRLVSGIEKAGASDTVRRVVTSGKASIVRA